jgi:hypothetical protein
LHRGDVKRIAGLGNGVIQFCPQAVYFIGVGTSVDNLRPV